MGLFERHGPSAEALANEWRQRATIRGTQLDAAERKVDRLRQIIVDEIEACDPDAVDRDCFPAGRLNFRRKGWLDGVRISRTVVRDRLRSALDDLADLY